VRAETKDSVEEQWESGGVLDELWVRGGVLVLVLVWAYGEEPDEPREELGTLVESSEAEGVLKPLNESGDIVAEPCERGDVFDALARSEVESAVASSEPRLDPRLRVSIELVLGGASGAGGSGDNCARVVSGDFKRGGEDGGLEADESPDAASDDAKVTSVGMSGEAGTTGSNAAEATATDVEASEPE